MKAIIMAGGDGTRLRPLSSNIPKPMVELFGKPVLGHILRLLRLYGVTDACLTLKYLPQVILDYVGDGAEFGIRLESRVETEALGTAGGVRNCSDFLGEEPFLIISGDCICDINLQAMMEFHNRQRADVTIALSRQQEPCEYGLVVTESDGRISHFLEKPAWDQVITDSINTGIYVVNPSILKQIPQGVPYDFGKDLFPNLLRKNTRLYGFKTDGYWCDIGSTAAYLQCCHDALDGDIDIIATNRVESDSLEGVNIIPPVFISAGARIEYGADIGPYAIIDSSTIIGTGAVVSHAVVQDAIIGDNAHIIGSIICKGTVVGRGAELCEGVVVGAHCKLGDGCVVEQGVRLWPMREVFAGTFVTESIAYGQLNNPILFNEPGTISGHYGVSLTAEMCLKLGAAAAAMGSVGLGCSGSDAAKLLAAVFGSGANSAGGDVIRHDAAFISCAIHVGKTFGLSIMAHFDGDDKQVSIIFTGSDGQRIAHSVERKLEAALREPFKTSLCPPGRLSHVNGALELYVSSALLESHYLGHEGNMISVAVSGTGDENRVLRKVLTGMGCHITPTRPGIITVEISKGGQFLMILDEEGRRLSEDQIITLMSHLMPQVDDGIYAAARLIDYLSANGVMLNTLLKKLPEVYHASRELELSIGRGTAMARLLADGFSPKESSGLTCHTGRGTVCVTPLRNRDAIRIRAESMMMETAEELCIEVEEHLRQLCGL